jgi:hypothetical protein
MSAVVVSRGDHVLLLRRSAAVTLFSNQWTIGINETMKYSYEPGSEEGLFGLVRRGLKEELGLSPGDYGRIHVTWFGWSEPAAAFHGVALVRSSVQESVIEERRESCHSVYEHDAVGWMPLNRKQIANVVTRGRCPDGTRSWSYFVPLVALELWRHKDAV